MDGSRFDDMAKALAVSASRRGFIRRLGGSALAATAALLGVADVAARCRSDSRTCRKHAHCCSGYCGRARGRRTCAPCESGIVCGSICCPADALTGCTAVDGPNGPIVGCLCPAGTIYDWQANQCRPCGPAASCRNDDDCCDGECCGGTCCPAGLACCNGVCCDDPGVQVCCNGACTAQDECFCPPGSPCQNAATCVSFGRSIYTSDDQCCTWPYVGFCCHETSPGAGDGAAGCCNVIGDKDSCWDDALCTTPITHPGYPICTPNSDECCELPPFQDPAFSASNCIWEGAPCHPDFPCCKGTCVAGACGCAGKGEACGTTGDCCEGMFCGNDDTCQ